MKGGAEKNINIHGATFDKSAKICYNQKVKRSKRNGLLRMSIKKKETGKETDLHAGHRRRLMERLKTGSLLEHEKLEALLFYAIPRRNTNDIAHRLLAEFGSLQGVMEASIEELSAVEGIGEHAAEFLYLLGRAFEEHYKTTRVAYQGDGKPETFFPYVCAFYEDEAEELLDVYCLNGKGRVYARVRLQGGEPGHVSIESCELSKALMDYSPAGIILVHNHPYGEASASETDIEMTKKCQLICSMFGVMLCDHVIYSPKGVFSFYYTKNLQGISLKYSLSALSEEGSPND